MVRAIKKIKNDINKIENLITAQLKHFEKLLLQSKVTNEPKIGIGMADKIVFVNISDILYCEATGSYTNIYLYNSKKMGAYKLLGEFESQLGENRFYRIHHSFLIKISRMKEFQRHDGGYVIMENNKQLEVSQRKRKIFWI